MESERIVMTRPLCSLCWDKGAEWEVLTPWDCWASLCDGCHNAVGGDGQAIIEAGAHPLIDQHDATAYLHSQTWAFARTMPKWPHSYVLARKSTDLWMHLRTVAFVRSAGELRLFRPAGRYHHYWQCCPDHEVWTMRPWDTILNRRDVIPDDF